MTAARQRRCIPHQVAEFFSDFVAERTVAGGVPLAFLILRCEATHLACQSQQSESKVVRVQYVGSGCKPLVFADVHARSAFRDLQVLTIAAWTAYAMR